MFFRVDNFFNFALSMNKIRSPASYTIVIRVNFCVFSVEKSSVRKLFTPVCEFAKI